MPIESANDLFVANGVDLRHWHNVSSDIIKYLRDKLDRAGVAVVYKGALENQAAFGNVQDSATHGDVWTNEETGVNMMWDGDDWVPVSLYRIDYDTEAIEGSERGIQSGYVWTALQNVITDPEIEEIIASIDTDYELQSMLGNISNTLSDLIQDMHYLQDRVVRIPNPIISTDNGNSIVQGDDGGVFLNLSESILNERLDAVERTIGTTVNTIVPASGEPVVVGAESPTVIFIEASEDVHLQFREQARNVWMMKYVYIEALNDIALSYSNAVFSDQSEVPYYGNAGYSILIRCIWIGGKIILEVIDNSQCAVNASQWQGYAGEEPDPDTPDPDNP